MKKWQRAFYEVTSIFSPSQPACALQRRLGICCHRFVDSLSHLGRVRRLQEITSRLAAPQSAVNDHHGTLPRSARSRSRTECQFGLLTSIAGLRCRGPERAFAMEEPQQVEALRIFAFRGTLRAKAKLL